MKRTMLIILLTFLSFQCFAPVGEKFIYIVETEPIYKYGIKDPVLRAFVSFESAFIEQIVNPVSGAKGILQYMPPMIKEVNRICKIKGIPNRYTWKDAYNSQKSIEMWYIVMNHKNPEYDIKKACKIWFGVGKQYDGMTWREYYREIQKRL